MLKFFFRHFQCFLHNFMCSHVVLIPSVTNCNVNCHENGWKDISFIGCECIYAYKYPYDTLLRCTHSWCPGGNWERKTSLHSFSRPCTAEHHSYFHTTCATPKWIFFTARWQYLSTAQWVEYLCSLLNVKLASAWPTPGFGHSSGDKAGAY